MKRTSVIGFLAASMFLLSIGFLGAQSNSVTVYTALPESENPVYFNAFQKATGIRVNFVRLSAGEMVTRIMAEKNNPLASVMMGGSIENYIAAAKDGLLAKYQSPELRNIPRQYYDPQGIYNPFYVGAISFACNSDWFKAKKLAYPTSWQDLLKPEFKGQISMAHPSSSGTSYTILASLIALMGENQAFDYFKKLNQNVRQYTKAGAAPPMEVGLGEAAIAITFSHDALQITNQGYPVVLSFPKEGTGSEIGGIALINNGIKGEQENAKKLIDFMLSKQGQELFITAKSNRVPLNSTAAISPGLIKIDTLKIISFDPVWAGNNKKVFVQKFIDEVDSARNLK